MMKTLLLLMGLSIGSVALYSVIPTDKPATIIGEWVLDNYKYEPLTEEAKHYRLDLEDKKKAKTIYTFNESGTAGFGKENGSDFFYISDSAKVYIWSGVDFPYTQTITEEIKKHERTQIMDASIADDNMELVMHHPSYRITLFLTRN